TSTSRVFFTPLPAAFFFCGASSPASSVAFLRRAVGPVGITGGGIGRARPTPADRRPAPPAPRIAAPAGRAPVGRRPVAGRTAIGARSPVAARDGAGRTAGVCPA